MEERNMGLKTETITIRVTEEQKERIKQLAAEKDWTVSKLLYNMLIKSLGTEPTGE
jgi:predicted DNA binding CopG/RHH family protein